MGKRACYLCDAETPILDQHHILPQFIGGKDTKVIDLCPTCHSGIHRQAHALLARSKKQFFKQDTLLKAKPLIEQIMAATIAAKENKSLKQRSLVTISVEPALLLMLHTMKKDAGYTNLQDFIHHLLIREARKRL